MGSYIRRKEISLASFEELYLTPMWKQGLIAEDPGGYVVGPQWELIRPYEEGWQRAREAHLSLEKLAKQEAWLDREELPFGRPTAC